jgi:alpha-D-ribose 1-methylphosphonate 5-triphosphate synthase subunit PhnL
MAVFGGYCSQIVPNLGRVKAAAVGSEPHFTKRLDSGTLLAQAYATAFEALALPKMFWHTLRKEAFSPLHR